MPSVEFSFLSYAEKIILKAYQTQRDSSILESEVMSRIAASVLTSPAAALDIGFHGLSCLYSLGETFITRNPDYVLPWQHLQRVRNAVAPLLFGSAVGLIHPFAAIYMSEPADKHAALALLYSNTQDGNFKVQCSPIDALNIIEDHAKMHRYCITKGVRKEIFTAAHLQAIRDANQYEKFLQIGQGQEFIYNVSNQTLRVMARFAKSIHASSFSDSGKEVLFRLSVVCVPVLTVVDFVIATLMQSVLMMAGVARLVSGRGPVFTEITVNPLAHAAMLLQNILKAIGNLLGTPIWIISPEAGFGVSLFAGTQLFQAQGFLLMKQIESRLSSLKEGECFVVPVLYGHNKQHEVSFDPLGTLDHKTYMIVKKEQGSFLLYWVDRPKVSLRKGLNFNETLEQIQSMYEARFPFMDKEKVWNYPLKITPPQFPNATPFTTLPKQGNNRNCIISNLFATLETIDRIQGLGEDVTQLRYMAMREAITKRYGFYKDDFSHFGEQSADYTIPHVWQNIENNPHTYI